jgi:hypothetical protein
VSEEAKVPLPTGALDPGQPWVYRGEDAVRSWEEKWVRPWTEDWRDMAAYFCWRTGESAESAFMWLAATYLGHMHSQIGALVDAYNRTAEVNASSTAESRERWEAGEEDRQRGRDFMERALRVLELQEQELREHRKGEDWRVDDEGLDP